VALALFFLPSVAARALPSFSIGNSSVTVSETGEPVAIFPVTLSAASTSSVSVVFSTSDGTAKAGVDYYPQSAKLVFPPGVTDIGLEIQVYNGPPDASGLTFNVTLSEPVNATITTGSAVCTIIHGPVPTAVSLNPGTLNTTAGAPSSLAATYNDYGGTGALTKVQLCVGALTYPSTSLYAAYTPATNLLYLYNANNVAVGGFAPGSSNVITTPLGSLDCSKTTVGVSGDSLSVAWNITPSSALGGVEYTYIQAADAVATTAWNTSGKWTISVPGAYLTSVTPKSLATNAGVETPVTALYGDGGGFAALTKVQICLGGLTYPSTSLYAAYLPATNLLYLYNASNVAVGGFAPGSANVITTGLGSLDCAKTTVTGSGDNLSVVWSIAPSAALAGTRHVYLQAADAGATSSWGNFGIWTVATPLPSVVGLTPASLSGDAGSSGTLTATYADSAGYGTLTKVQVCLGGLTYPATSLYAAYFPGTNLLYLYNASNVAVGGFAPGSNNVITTPLGSLNCAATTVSGSGDTLTVAWSITPGTALSGTQNLYLQSADAESTSNWALLGTWTIIPEPANDDFANAQVLSGPSGSVNGTTIGATVEAGEPDTNVTSQTVWYEYTASMAGPGEAVFTVSSAQAESFVYVFTGSSLTNITPVGNWVNYASFATNPGQTYYLQVGADVWDLGYTNTPSNFTVQWSWGQFPANTYFANAIPISGSSGSVSGTTVGATGEAADPNWIYEYTSQRYPSVWYRYTAPAYSVSPVTFVLSAYGAEQSLWVFTGSNLATLTGVNSGVNALVIPIAAGATCDIQVMSEAAMTGPFTLSWSQPVPPNDNFAKAQVLTGASGSVVGSTDGATVQTGEPNAGSASV